jgi:hypothetical protein
MSCFFFFLSDPGTKLLLGWAGLGWAGLGRLYTLEKTLALNEGGSCHAGRARGNNTRAN